MAEYATAHGFVLAPHGKTTMAPKLFQRQLEAGAWAITVANMTQAAVAFEAGAQRVLVANEVVSLADARVIVDALATRSSPGRTRPSTRAPSPRRARRRDQGVYADEDGRRQLYCLVDSVAGVELLDSNLGRAGMDNRVGVFVELGVPGGRTGAAQRGRGGRCRGRCGRQRPTSARRGRGLRRPAGAGPFPASTGDESTSTLTVCAA